MLEYSFEAKKKEFHLELSNILKMSYVKFEESSFVFGDLIAIETPDGYVIRIYDKSLPSKYPDNLVMYLPTSERHNINNIQNFDFFKNVVSYQLVLDDIDPKFDMTESDKVYNDFLQRIARQISIITYGLSKQQESDLIGCNYSLSILVNPLVLHIIHKIKEQ